MSRNKKVNKFDQIIKIMEISKKISSFGLSAKCEGKSRPLIILFPAIFGPLTVVCAACAIKGTIESGENIEASGAATLLAIGVFQATIKTVSVLLQEKKIDFILRWIRNLYSNHKNESNSLFNGHMERAEKNVYLFVRIFLYSFGSAFFILLIYMNLKGKLLLAFPYLSTNYFNTHTIGGSLLLFYDVINLAISESTMILIGIYLIATLNILSDLIFSLNEKFQSGSDKQSNNSILQQIVILHIEILSKFREFCNIFDVVFAIQLFSSVLLLLFNFYLLMYSLTDFLYICLIGCIFCQLALFCLFGQKIHEKSERIFIDLYLTKWYEMDVKDQKILLLIMKMSQKTLGLKAGGIYAIDSSMFVQVTKMCFSYATILYTFL
uniref:Odorant receptor n=1 Tax=Lutzomyia longipalpis TaxID=7200 RepID=A0A240SXT5_LUTLO